jgi:hypothetical protein
VYIAYSGKNGRFLVMHVPGTACMGGHNLLLAKMIIHYVCKDVVCTSQETWFFFHWKDQLVDTVGGEIMAVCCQNHGKNTKVVLYCQTWCYVKEPQSFS